MELTDELQASFKAELLAEAQNSAYYAAIDEWINASTVVYSDEAQAMLNAVPAAE